MTREEFDRLILHGDLAGLVAVSRTMTDEQRQEWGGLAREGTQKRQRMANLGIDQKLRDADPREWKRLMDWTVELTKQHPDPRQAYQVIFAIALAYCIVATDDELRQSLEFYSKVLQQKFIVCREQCEVLIARQLPSIVTYLKSKKHLDLIDDSLLMPFIKAGLIDKNQLTPQRYLTSIWYEFSASPALKTRRRSEILIQDYPEIIDDLWLAFEVPTLAECLVYVPRSSDQSNELTFHDSLGSTFCQLCEAGRMDRTRLLKTTIQSIGRDDFDSNQQKHFAAFHNHLEITTEEQLALSSEYVALLSSRAPHSIKFALDILSTLEKNKQLDGPTFYAGAGAVFQLKPKAHPKAALSLSEKHVKRCPASRCLAIDLALVGLIHDAVEVQTQALKQLELWSAQFTASQTSLLRERLPLVAASLQSRMQELVQRVTPSTDAMAGVPESSKPEASEFATESSVSQWLETKLDEARQIPEPWRSLAGIDDAISAARLSILPKPAPFRPIDVPVLTAVDRITPILDLDELFDAVAHMIERVDSADEVERVIDGIARLADQRPENFAKRAVPMLLRLPANIGNFQEWKGANSNGGLSSALAYRDLQGFIITWLQGKPSGLFDLGYHVRLNLWQAQRLKELQARVVNGQSTQLLSTPTHQGGWIDATVLGPRVADWQQGDDEVLPQDFALALLRTAPDNRLVALEAARELKGNTGRIVRWALGGNEGPTSADSADSALWLAAGRCRVPDGEVPELKQFPELCQLPFGAERTVLTWKQGKLTARQPNRSSFATEALLKELTGRFSENESDIAESKGFLDGLQTLVNMNANKEKSNDSESIPEEEISSDKVDANLVAYWLPRTPSDIPRSHITACMAHYVRSGHTMPSSPPWERQWMATSWPLNTDPYFSAALTAIRWRLNSSKSSVFDPNHVLLEPLFHPDRPWTEMGCLLIALAALSREADTRNVAVDVLITSVSDGRADHELLAAIWSKMSTMEFVKLNRISEALTATALVSPLHQWFAAEVVQRIIAGFTDWPTDGHHLLVPLVEWLTDLQMPLTADARSTLTRCKPKGKAAKLSQSLLSRSETNSLSVNQRTALQTAIEQRLARAHRWAASQ
jgi:hypothetical protein